MLADRVHNDFLMLSLRDRIDTLNLDFTILASNHDLEFINFIESIDSLEATEIYDKYIPLLGFRLSPSLTGLIAMMQNKLVTLDQVKRLYFQHYVPHLKLIDYELTERGIDIYSHAPISIKIIQALARHYQVSGDCTTAQSTANLIDGINTKFIELVRAGKLYQSLDQDPDCMMDYPKAKPGTLQAALGNQFIDDMDPVVRCMWNRRLFETDITSNQGLAFEVNFVFGHIGPDKPDNFPDNYHNLDTNLGKSTSESRGELPIHCSYANLAPRQEATAGTGGGAPRMFSLPGNEECIPTEGNCKLPCNIL